MKKILIALSTALLLTSCGAKNPETQTGTVSTGSTQTGTIQATTTNVVADGKTVKAYYILRDTDENGEIIESNMDTDGNPTGAPFSTQMGVGGMIPGFESAIMGMKTGETKAFSVSPEQGYGTGLITREVVFEDIAPIFSITENKNILAWKIREEQQLSQITEENKKQYIEGKNIGDVISEENGIKVTLVEKTDTTVTVEIENPQSPFYGKEIKAGTSTSMPTPNSDKEMTLTITKVEGDNVTLEVKNSASPFDGKEFVVGATGERDENGKKMEYKVLAINETEGIKKVNLEMTNPHRLANKTLHFTVKIDEISEGLPALDLSAIQ